LPLLFNCVSCSRCPLNIACSTVRDKPSVDDESVEEYVVAVAGNPNVGKSTLFNILTGGKQRVGNWPGKTIERKEGARTVGNVKLKFVDLPGTYSLSALSLEEVIARRFIVEAKPNVVINIVDASNLERNLYLTLQILELTKRVVIALNMMDLAKSKGLKINVKKLSQKLGVPVIPMIAIRGEGLNELIDTVMEIVKNKVSLTAFQINYGDKIEDAISIIVKVLDEHDISSKLPYPLRWMAVRLLEGDREIIREILAVDSSIITKIEQLKNELSEVLGEDVDVIIADKRYELIEEIIGDVVEKPSKKPLTLTDRIDRIVLNKYLGLPLLLSIFMLSFMVIFSVNIGFPLNLMFPELESFNLASLIGDYIFGYISDVVSSYLISINTPEWLVSLIVDGVISGVGSVLSFYPLVFTVFILFGVLEDSGYMARAAFIMDRIMRKFGLTGRAFMPLMLGYGCNIPSVMATRILPSGRDRLLSILLSSLIPCQARLATFTIIIAAIFHNFALQIAVMLFLYALSLFLVFLMGILFNKLFFREEPSFFIMELPPYHRPSLKVVLWHAEERSKHFLIKAGTIIFSISIIVWFLTSYGPSGYVTMSEMSFAAFLGDSLSVIFGPVGLNDWRIVVALITGFMAKEAVPETFAIISNVSDPIEAVTVIGLTPLSAFSLLIITLLYVPCLATVAAIYKETRSVKWTIFTVLYLLSLSYLVALIFYNLGLILGFR